MRNLKKPTNLIWLNIETDCKDDTTWYHWVCAILTVQMKIIKLDIKILLATTLSLRIEFSILCRVFNMIFFYAKAVHVFIIVYSIQKQVPKQRNNIEKWTITKCIQKKPVCNV